MNKLKILSLVVITMALVFTSCNSLKKTATNALIKEFISAGNELANIELRMFNNKSFKMKMDFLPSMDMGSKLEKFDFNGTWELVNNKYELKFKGKHPDLNALFDNKLSPSKDIKILDERSFSFPADAKGIYIWGIYCPLKSIKN